MNCQEIQFDLPLYSDDALSSESVANLRDHLDECPVCRQKLADLQKLRSGLRNLARPLITDRRIESIRSAVASQIPPRQGTPGFRPLEPRGRWIETWLMPSTFGVTASLVLSITFLWLLLQPAVLQEYASASGPVSRDGRQLLLTSSEPTVLDLSPLDYANTRLAISQESPSINPHGALIALTRSLMRGEMNDDELVVVASVFGDGLARIEQVVEPAYDDKAILELQRALQTDPAFAPFVPANFDRRSDSVRVILKFQNVSVNAYPDSPGL
jgi:hypothetical protein